MNTGGMEETKLSELRKNKRIDYFSKAYCRKSMHDGETEEYEQPLELMLINISVGGLGIVSEKIFEKDTVMLLDLKLEDEHYEKVTAKVMWTIRKGDMFRHGLELMNVSGRLYRHLSRLDNSVTTTV